MPSRLLTCPCPPPSPQDILAQASAFTPLILAGLQHTVFDLKVASLSAACTLLGAVDAQSNPAAAQALAPLLPATLTTLGQVLQSGEVLPSRDSLAAMINLAKANPGVLKSRLDDIASALTTVCATQGADEDTRRLGMELLTTVSEAHGGMARKSATLVQNSLLLALTMATELDDDASWAGREFDEFNDTSGDDDQSINYTGEQALNRLAFALGGESVVPVIMGKLPGMLQGGSGAATGAGGSWQYRRAAVLALGILAEPCKKQLKGHLEEVVSTLVAHMSDPEVRVRHSALVALGSVGSAFKAKRAFMNKFAGQVLPALAQAVGQGAGSAGNPPRVSATAAACVIDLCRTDSALAKDVTPHLESLLKAAISLLQAASQPAVLVKALGCIAVVAAASASAFKAYYAELMPLVSQVIVNPPTGTGSAEATKTVQGSAMECVALMGEAVGAETFAPDAKVVLNTLLTILKAGSTMTNDPSLRYLQDSVARIGRVLGPEAFAPYLPSVLPALLAAATRKVQASFTDAEAESVSAPYTVDQASGTVTMALDVRGVGVKQVTLNTSEMEERTHAVKLLSEYIQFMGPALAGHLQELAAAMLPNVSYWSSHTIRRTAAHCYARIVGAAAASARTSGVPAGSDPATSAALTAVVQIAQDGLVPLLKEVTRECNDEARIAQSEAVGDILGALMCGGDLEVDETPEYTQSSRPWFGVPLEMAVGIVRTMLGVLAKDVDSHMSTLKAVQEDPDADETSLEMLDEQLEANDQVIRHCVDAIGYLIKVHRAAFLPIAEAHVVPVMHKLLHSDMPDHLNFCAMCTFTDLLEWCGEGGHKYTDVLMPAVLTGIGSDYPLLRQCALYTAGIMALQAPAAMVRMNVLDATVRGCISVMGAPDAQDEDNVHATENAVSTLGKLLLHVAPLQTSTTGAQPSAVANAASAYWKAWMQRLPLREDVEEARWCNATLSTAAATGNATMMGAGSPPANLPLALSVMGEVLVQAGGGGGEGALEVADEQTLARIGAIFKQIQGSAPALLQGLSPAAQAAAAAAASRA